MSASGSIDDSLGRSHLARALFKPSSIALVGASEDPSRLTSRPQRVLRRHGFKGRIVSIHPSSERIGAEHAYRSIGAVPAAVDHAFVMVPAVAVPRAIEDCAAAGVKVATVFSAGFSETGVRGKRRQDALLASARATGMRLIGPNCLALVDVPGQLVLSANAILEHERLQPGGLSVLSQSGSMLAAILTRAQERGLGFSKLVAVGNECDIAVGELMHLLVDDPDTRAILLFLETFRDAPVLAQAARRAFDAGKPVIAMKLGRSALGRRIASTHTGAIAGDDEVAGAFLRSNGIIRVDVFEALFETAQLVLGHRPPAGRRVGALTVSGGAAAMVVDRLGIAGIELAAPPDRVIDELAARRIRISDAALTDLPMGRADAGTYAAILDQLLASNHCDLVLAIQGSNATHMPESVHTRILAAKRGAKPLAVFVGPRAEQALRLLHENAVAGFRTPESCADAIRAYCDWRAPEPLARVDADDVRTMHTIRTMRCAVRAAGHGMLNERAAADLLAGIGVPFARSCIVQSGTDAIDLPYPVAAKILSPDIAHKTEASGVALDIADPAMLARRIDAMLAHVRRAYPRARIEGVLIQSMQQRAMAELIVGYRRDPAVGPIMLVGVGGILAEICRGHAIRLAPVSIATAAEMIAEAPGLDSIRGLRNRPVGDLEALAQVVHRVSLLACEDSVLEAEINPLLVRSDGIVAVDALVRLAEHALDPPGP